MRGNALSIGKVIRLAIVCPLLAGATSTAIDGDDSFRLLRLDGYHVKWGDSALGAGATVRYAFVDRHMRFDSARNCRELAPLDQLLERLGISEATLQEEARAAFRAWEEAGDITFVPVDDADQADILIGAQRLRAGRAYANVEYQPGSDDSLRTIGQALVCLNSDQRWKVGFDGDTEVYDLRYTLVHEIGHAIGLDHPGPSGQVMSYRYSEAYDSLQPGDYRGVQILYGVSTRRMTASHVTE